MAGVTPPGADVDIYELVLGDKPDVGLLLPRRVRVNGVDVGLLQKDGIVVDLGDGYSVPTTVTLTLLVRSVRIRHAPE